VLIACLFIVFRTIKMKDNHVVLCSVVRLLEEIMFVPLVYGSKNDKRPGTTQSLPRSNNPHAVAVMMMSDSSRGEMQVVSTFAVLVPWVLAQ
jgi:hypothetical protein